MFKKVLIANRGEIALRVMRACKELGVRTVAVHSEPDVDSLHVRFADEDVCIGPGAATDSYLSIPNIISAAQITGADAIHPGYGFLAENAHFAEVCEECKIRFIGPSPDAIRKMGDKALAKSIAKKAGLNTIPGTDGAVDDEKAAREAKRMGFPVIIKASAGGGGKGMRVVTNPDELKSALQIARLEAEKAFKNSDIYMEKYIENPRHVEIQLLADNSGKTVHLNERDCSIQRRHQKLIEESPSPAVDEKLRAKMGWSAKKLAREVGYTNAGTVEFLIDQNGNYFFMEMNTRVQVEHPVTEMCVGLDIVKEQIRIASGEPIPFSERDIRILGHAIECRINAEDPENDFSAFPGKITGVNIPGGPGIRVDTHIYTEYEIPSYYDSLIAKLIAFGRDRREAIARMSRALEEFVIEGVPTTISFHQMIMRDEDFIEGRTSTKFLEEKMNAFKNGRT